MNKTIVSLFGTFSVKVMTAIISFILSIIIARHLAVEDMGYYQLSITILMTAVVFSKLGLDNIILKVTSVFYSQGNWSSIEDTKKYTELIVLFYSLFISSILFFMSDYMSKVLFGISDKGNYIRLLSLFLLPLSLLHFNSERLKGIGNIVLGSFLQSLNIVLLNLLMITLIVFYDIRNNTLFLLSYLFSILISYIISIIIWHIKIKNKVRLLKNEEDFYNKNPKTRGFFVIKSLLKQSLPLIMVSSMNLLLSYMDIYMLGFFSNSSEVALYSISSKIVLMSSMILVAFNSVIGPKIAYYFSSNNLDKIERLIQKTTLSLFIIGSIIQILIILFGKLILSFYGEEYTQAYTALIILSIGQFAVLATGPVASFLIMTNKQKIHKNSVFISLVINFLLNLILIQKYGLLGAALATTISIIIKNIIEVFYIKYNVGINIYLNWVKIIKEDYKIGTKFKK